jgi:Zn finger protein HypA/HybF involved in hydrogenase expression
MPGRTRPVASRIAAVYIAGLGEREELRMSETRLVCRVCDGVFSEHQVRLKMVDPEEDQVQCPDCGSSRMEPYA